MLNFTYYNPTRIVFGAGSIARLDVLVPADVVAADGIASAQAARASIGFIRPRKETEAERE